MPPDSHRESLPRFADVPDEFASFERARVLVLPVPYERTTTYLKGTADGPAAILRASTQVEFRDEVLDAEPFRVGLHTLPPLDVTGEPEAVVARIAERIASLPIDRLVVTLGGEHTVMLGALRAHHERHPDLALLVLDAHDDLRDEYEGSSLNHACVSRRAGERCPVVQVGVRSVSDAGARIARRYPIEDAPSPPRAEGWGERRDSDSTPSHPHSNPLPERERALRIPSPPVGETRGGAEMPNRVLTFPAEAIYRHGMPTETIISALPERVYLSVDVDVFDPAWCPGVGTPEPGGLDWYQVTDLIAAVAAARRIVGFDIVEVRPLPDQVATEFLAAKLVYRTIGLIARSAGWPPLG